MRNVHYCLEDINILSYSVVFIKMIILLHFHSCFRIDSFIKGALSGLRQFLATESPLKLMKNVFYFISKALFVLKIFKFLS